MAPGGAGGVNTVGSGISEGSVESLSAAQASLPRISSSDFSFPKLMSLALERSQLQRCSLLSGCVCCWVGNRQLRGGSGGPQLAGAAVAGTNVALGKVPATPPQSTSPRRGTARPGCRVLGAAQPEGPGWRCRLSHPTRGRRHRGASGWVGGWQPAKADPPHAVGLSAQSPAALDRPREQGGAVAPHPGQLGGQGGQDRRTRPWPWLPRAPTFLPHRYECVITATTAPAVLRWNCWGSCTERSCGQGSTQGWVPGWARRRRSTLPPRVTGQTPDGKQQGFHCFMMPTRPLSWGGTAGELREACGLGRPPKIRGGAGTASPCWRTPPDWSCGQRCRGCKITLGFGVSMSMMGPMCVASSATAVTRCTSRPLPPPCRATAPGR